MENLKYEDKTYAEGENIILSWSFSRGRLMARDTRPCWNEDIYKIRRFMYRVRYYILNFDSHVNFGYVAL